MIVLSTGFKINAPVLESLLEAHPDVTSALMFGNGRPRCGLIVEANGGNTDSETTEKVWPLIEASNENLPEHGRIEKGMVRVASSEKPFVRAGKGTVVRAVTEELYEQEIQQLY